MSAIKAVKIKRIFADGTEKVIADRVTLEKLFVVKVQGVVTFKLLCTPIDLRALIVGYLYTEKIIKYKSDIEKIVIKGSNAEVHLKKKPVKKFLIANNCIKEISTQKIFYLIEQLQKLQKYFPLTGSTHAAAIFNQDGKILAFAEDIARHNALDKAIGKCVLHNIELSGCGIALSSRVSFEMINKAVGIDAAVVISVSAPSSLAIQAATKHNITLCSFVRESRMNLYTHPKRIKFARRVSG